MRSEIQENLSFSPKETDIYKIHQSGDLANLDGLDDTSLKLLPSLLTLRDALYSSTFREYLSTVTGSGPLSGGKTDMAINVYTPGCHLLCHDDVIGSRRVSYILYLTSPDKPWKKDWGGALRLYPTEKHVEQDGHLTKMPSPDFTVSIPPAFNQLSFFAVQPGESFHDVEEVYASSVDGKSNGDGERIRMAISGWYHIPQKGETGFEAGLEQKLAEKSSLVQLQGKANEYDLPQPQIRSYDQELPLDANETKTTSSNSHSPGPAQNDRNPDADALTESDLDFLLKYLSPTYLTPDTLDSLSSLFEDQSSFSVEKILSQKFSSQLRTWIEDQQAVPLPTSTSDIESKTSWRVARPPHKHRYLFMQPSSSQFDTSNPNPTPPDSQSRSPVLKATWKETSPLTDLLVNLFPSIPFRKWLQLATGLTLTSHNVLARRFRKGKDYTLATGWEGEARLEVCLGVTEGKGWGNDQVEGDDDAGKKEENEAEGQEGAKKTDNINGKANDGAKDDSVIASDDVGQGEEKKVEGLGGVEKTDDTKEKANKENESVEQESAPVLDAEPEVGGYEVYMAADDNNNHDSPKSSDPQHTSNDKHDHGVSVPPALQSSNTGAYASGSSRRSKPPQNDPAIYQAASSEDEEDAILFTNPAGWNKLSVVLRDRGVLRFVKYVSRQADGDRWDLQGEFGVEEDDDEDEDENGEVEKDKVYVKGNRLDNHGTQEVGYVGLESDEEEDVIESEDSDSDSD